MKRYLEVKYINIFLFGLMLFFGFSIEWLPFEEIAFYPDSLDYISQSKKSIFSIEFYFPQIEKRPPPMSGLLYPRTFIIPLIYKIAGGDPHIIYGIQTFWHCLTTFFLASASLLVFNRKSSQFVFIFFWYLFMSWWNVFGWNTVMLSESISTSLLFMWLASFLYVIKKHQSIWYVLHIIITVFFAFSRDNWPLVLITFYGSYVLVYFIKRKKFQRFLVLLLLTGIMLIIQQKSSDVGYRHRLPVLNNIAFRIMPNADYTQWFVDRGMPNSDSLAIKYPNLRFDQSIYPLYSDSSFVPLFNWIKEEGKTTFTKFLITHPEYTLLLKQPKGVLLKGLNFDNQYHGFSKGFTQISEPIFPLFSLSVVLILIGSLFILFLLKEKREFIVFCYLLGIFTFFNMVVCFNADAVEVNRHLIHTNLLIQFIGILTTVVWVDSDILKKFGQVILNSINELRIGLKKSKEQQ